MPELPEVQTTVNGLKQHVVGLTIADVWTDYNSPYFAGSETIKDPAYFKKFRKTTMGARIISVERRAKNIIINLDTRSSIIVHMKMTGHLLYGTYRFDPGNNRRDGRGSGRSKDPWVPLSPESLKDPFNRHVHFLISFTNKKHLALSDVRKFAKVTLVTTDTMHDSVHLRDIGPEPLEVSFTFQRFCERLARRPSMKIKQALTDQSLLAGIGNIYADESLWRAGIHPLQRVSEIPSAKMKGLFTAIKQTLARGIDFGGDSTSDYRNVLGDKGEFHETHRAYQRTGEICSKRGCRGMIRRIVVGGRGTHFCDTHQVLKRVR